jgi:hypothetical protein
MALDARRGTGFAICGDSVIPRDRVEADQINGRNQ